MKAYFDRHRKDSQIRIGDFVYIRTPVDKDDEGRKLARYFSGPFIITNLLPFKRVQIKNLQDDKLYPHPIHISLLKLASHYKPELAYHDIRSIDNYAIHFFFNDPIIFLTTNFIFLTDFIIMASTPTTQFSTIRYLLWNFLLIFITMAHGIQFQAMPKREFYTRTEYGVIFRPIPTNFIPTDSYTHVFF